MTIQFKRGRDKKKRRKRRFVRSVTSKIQKGASSVRRRTTKLGLKGAGQAVKGDLQRKTARTRRGKAVGIKNSLVGRAKAAPAVLSARVEEKAKKARK